MPIITYIVDSFTDVPFKGNPAGVCWPNAPLDAGVMLSIAQELGLSETAFITPTEAGRYSIRYFSPKMEIDLCGHATLAAAKTLFHENAVLTDIVFVTGQGLELFAARAEDEITMRFPAYNVTPSEVPTAMLRALGLSGYKAAFMNADIRSLMIEIDSAEILARLTPDYAALLASHDGIDGVCVTALSSAKEFDFESRYFWPWSGTNEDPVTGAAHCVLAPFWGQRLGKIHMRARQCSARSGFMALEVTGDNVLIKASAQIVFKGEMFV